MVARHIVQVYSALDGSQVLVQDSVGEPEALVTHAALTVQSGVKTGRSAPTAYVVACSTPGQGGAVHASKTVNAGITVKERAEAAAVLAYWQVRVVQGRGPKAAHTAASKAAARLLGGSSGWDVATPVQERWASARGEP